MPIEEVRELDPWERLRYFIQERESIRLKKEAGEKPPWTDDLILHQFRFCNVRRMDDKVSKWLLSNWYEPYFDHPNMLVAVALARFINLPETLQAVGFPDVWDLEEVKAVLDLRKSSGYKTFNAAYIVAGRPGFDKITSVVDHYCNPLVEFPPEIDTSSMEATWRSISAMYGYGSFMAGQVVADLRWAMSGTWADRDTWAPRGPGSSRGINRLFGFHPDAKLSDRKFYECLTEMREVMKAILPTSITDRLEAHDYQSCMCEVDKYERALWGEGTPKQRYWK